MSELEPTRTYSNPTATDVLRRMLDERGVEWEDGGEGLTIIPVQDGVPQAWTVNTWPSGKDMGDCLWVQNRHPLTPEQAVAATVGRGTCHDTGTFKSWGLFTCSNCSIVVPLNAAKDAPEIGKVMPLKFCPNCGCRLEVDA